MTSKDSTAGSSIESFEDVAESDSDEWEHEPRAGRYGVECWVHESGVVFGVRGPNKNRLTLHEPYDDPREAEELEGVETDGARSKALILMYS